MPNDWSAIIQEVKDEQTFLQFLRTLREDWKNGGADSDLPWESETIGEFLDSAIDWGARGDFGEGQHYGDPMLRRVAAMLFTGRWKLRE